MFTTKNSSVSIVGQLYVISSHMNVDQWSRQGLDIFLCLTLVTNNIPSLTRIKSSLRFLMQIKIYKVGFLFLGRKISEEVVLRRFHAMFNETDICYWRRL